MSDSNRRQADRLEVGFSAKVMTHVSSIEASVCDLSRTGVRLRFEGENLGFPITADLAELEGRLRGILPEPLFVTLDDGRLGSLIQKLAVMRRLGLPADRVATLDVCCAFTEPLGEEEAHFLSVPLPPVQESVETWRDVGSEDAASVRGLPEETPQGRAAPAVDHGPRHRYRVLVSSARSSGPPSLFCYTDLVTAVGVRIRLPRGQVHCGKETAISRAPDALRLLVKCYGRAVRVRVFDGADEVWSGSMTVTGVELPARDAGQMLVSLGFTAPLKPPEKRRFGLYPSAA